MVTDTPTNEIDWAGFFEDCARAAAWGDMHRAVYVSGVLVSDYVPGYVDEDDWEDMLERASIDELRNLFTDQIRQDHFSYGSGAHDFWKGTFDEVLAALASRLHMPYDVPRRVLPCPTCGDTDKVQTVVVGMPAGMPTPQEEKRFYFAGCVIDGDMGDWYCPTCETFHSVPWVDPFVFHGDDTKELS